MPTKRQKRITLNTGSFMQPRFHAIMAALTRMLLTPGIFLPEEVATTAHIGPPLEKKTGLCAEKCEARLKLP